MTRKLLRFIGRHKSTTEDSKNGFGAKLSCAELQLNGTEIKNNTYFNRYQLLNV